jgi:pyrroline-5-carboxylate reductase
MARAPRPGRSSYTVAVVAGTGPSGTVRAGALAQALRAGSASDSGFAVLQQPSSHADIVIVLGEHTDALEALRSLMPRAGRCSLLVSGLTGVSLAELRSALGPGPALCRLVVSAGVPQGEGTLVLTPEPGIDPALVKVLTRLLALVGTVEVMSEGELDAVGGVVPAGAGFLALALEGMEEGAVEAGLPPEIARPLVRQTALATALLLQDHPGSPADLKDQVASPGGTTIAGLSVLEDAGVRGAFIRAVEQAARPPGRGRDAGGPRVIE